MKRQCLPSTDGAAAPIGYKRSHQTQEFCHPGWTCTTALLVGLERFPITEADGISRALLSAIGSKGSTVDSFSRALLSAIKTSSVRCSKMLIFSWVFGNFCTCSLGADSS